MSKDIKIEDIFRLVSGHSIYSGDSILSAFTCLSEGKDVKPIKPLDVMYYPQVDGITPSVIIDDKREE